MPLASPKVWPICARNAGLHHRLADIKPENILLDVELCPKIAGLDINMAMTTVRGTIGYLAPEWVYGQAITHKADIYNFQAEDN